MFCPSSSAARTRSMRSGGTIKTSLSCRERFPPRTRSRRSRAFTSPSGCSTARRMVMRATTRRARAFSAPAIGRSRRPTISRSAATVRCPLKRCRWTLRAGCRTRIWTPLSPTTMPNSSRFPRRISPAFSRISTMFRSPTAKAAPTSAAGKRCSTRSGAP